MPSIHHKNDWRRKKTDDDNLDAYRKDNVHEKPPRISRLRGSRVAPPPPGEGGDVFLTAPQELCADASHE
jgi:hypothetical protein